MDLKEQIKLIADEIRPQFQTLADFGFMGIGTPEEATGCFVDAYEGYVKAKELYMESVGHLPQNGSYCQFISVDIDESELEAAYSIAKAQGFLPPPLVARVYDFAVYMNAFFMATQRD